jgi:microcystin-dependent protein
MALSITHTFVSPKLDGPDPTVVRPSNWNDEHKVTGSGWMLAGMVFDFVGHTVPTYLLECFGQSVAASAYPLLFTAMVKQGTVTFTLGSPGTVNWASHGLPIGSKVRFRVVGAGALPSGIVTGTDYYIISSGFSAAAFRIAATPGGTAIVLGGTPSGTFNGINAQFGASSDLATFTIPDLRGRVTAGLDTMGGTAAGRVTTASGISGDVLGASGGDDTHTLTAAQIAAHQHNNNPPNPVVSLSAIGVTVNAVADHTHTVTGTVNSGGAFTPTGSLDTAAAHVHSIDPPSTATTAGGAGSTHTHTIPALSGVTDTEAAHTHPDTFAATFTGSPHSHGMTTSLELISRDGGTSGGRNFAQDVDDTGGTGTVKPTNSATAGGSVSISGAVSGGGSHAHTVTTNASTTGSGGGGADHTHTVQIAPFNSVSGGAHSHTFTGTAVAAHTHTFSAGAAAASGGHTHTATATGTATSTLADFLSDAAGGGASHPNMQPTYMLRKVIYVG